ncbi:MAG: hypothetical protein ACVCEJ_03890 [Candidatus Izemoplasmataceae bacterium]
MEKFARISRITTDYLHGTLHKLIFQYEGPNKVHIVVSYEDRNEYWFDYELDLNMNNHHVDFNSHRLASTLEKVQISRDEHFEQALQELFD